MTRKMPIIFLLMLIAFSVISLACKEKRYDHEAEIIVSTLTLEEKIGQMLIMAVPGREFNDTTAALLSSHLPGGIIYFGYNIESDGQIRDLTNEYQRYSMETSGIPLFVSIDQEGGRVIRLRQGVTQFPGNMAAGVGNNPKLVYSWGRILGLELRSLGINMNLAPVVDVNNNPDNPVINIRSFGSDPDIVARLGSAYVRGIQESRCIAVAKHFPGHGDTDKDSHYTLPVIHHDMDRLKEIELYPFQKTIEAGVDGIMTAHISYPAILPQGESATVSRIFMTDLLRDEMKFQGLVMTDDMEMHAISRRMDVGQAAVMSIDAGVDIILVSSWGQTIDAITGALKNAVATGLLTEERIDESVVRVLEAKLRYGIMKFNSEEGTVEPAPFVPSEQEQQLMAVADDINIRLSREGLYYYGDRSLLSQQNVKKIIVTTDSRFAAMASRLRNGIAVMPGQVDAEITKTGGQAVVYYHEKSFSAPDTALIESLSRTAVHRTVPFVVIATGNPFPMAKMSRGLNVLYSFSATPASLDAVIDVLSEKIEPSFSIPFNLTGDE